ncbi:hypothetical protein ACOKFD_00630 [Flagellimonas sp. S174]|uniref:hypothetical protein n=1 Tax=Flagellimonas sp. S174 TaxID=3410790 RepID=UPI003BF5BE0B
MKTYSTYLLVTLLVFTLTNCSNDDNGTIEPEPTVSELLIGKWFIEEKNNIKVPEGCLDRTFYQFIDGQNVVSEQFSSAEIDSECFSTGIYASPYTINATNEVVFDIQDELFGIVTVTLEIIEISTNELTGTLQDRFGGAEYKLIKDL